MRLSSATRMLTVLSIVLLVGYGYLLEVRAPCWPVWPIEWRTVAEVGLLITALVALVEQVDLLKADGINVSRFLREQIETLYEDPTASPQETRGRLVQRAHESLARHRAAQAERDADLERARAAVREKRAERDAAISRHGSILEALVQIGGDGTIGRLSRMLPENDFNGDRVDDWEALVRRVSRLCGAEIDSAEVAAGVRALVAKA